jgi:hypothetical protein
MTIPSVFTPAAYGPIFAGLLEPARLAPLGPGQPNQAVYPSLKSLELASAFAPRRIADPEMAGACLAGLWLYHDFLEESHQISQELPSPTGAYWHGLMHRREPDYANSKYWFRRVGAHPVFPALREAAAGLGGLMSGWKEWDAFSFADLCEKALREGGELEELCRQVQRIEWELLFDFCYKRAVGA